MPENITKTHRFLIIFAIVFAGEIIFSLPFHVARFFRPTLLDVFSISNTQLGDIFSLYGIMAMLAYFPGGAIADRFSSRKLMAFSLFATALGGIAFIQIPNETGLMWLFGYWGVTTILLFWAAMIKTTRLWGGSNTQGLAFGILDGGRGFVAAGVATISVVILSMGLTQLPDTAQLEDKTLALQYVIAFYAILTLAAGVLVLVVIPKSDLMVTRDNDNSAESSIGLQATWFTIIKQPKVLLQALIVLSAYCAYKSLDYFGIYATDVLGLSDIEAAQLVSNASFSRPIVALAAGLIADRLQPSRLVSWSFALLVASYLLLPSVSVDTLRLLQLNVLVTFVLVFAVRAVYFALIAQTQISGAVTGTAVGIISVIGFTPDIFFAPIAGRILDSAPGAEGFSMLFIILAIITLVGMSAAYLLARLIGKTRPSLSVQD